MSNVDRDGKKDCHSDVPTPQNLPPKLGSRQNLKSIFTIKQSNFCNFDIKNEFLDPKTPM